MGKKIISLEDVPEGHVVRVVNVLGGRGVTYRLLSMGLVPGSSVKIVHNKGVGPIIIEVRGTRIGIGRGLARKVLVEEDMG